MPEGVWQTQCLGNSEREERLGRSEWDLDQSLKDD